MLDRAQLARDVLRISDKLFPDLEDTAELAYNVWCDIAKDPDFVRRAREAESSFLIPSWEGNLLETFKIKPIDQKTGYTVISIDGSQIYPDRHMAGAGCFLVNIGGAILSYGPQTEAQFFSDPRVMLPDDFKISPDFTFSPDMVDLVREEDELRVAYEKAAEIKNTNKLVLIDGSIIFWYLEGKSPDIRDYYIKRYIAELEKFYQDKILCAGYISLPKSRELINLVKLGLCRYTIANCIPCHSIHDNFPCKQVDQLVDTVLTRTFLNPGERTIIFQSNSNIIDYYPEHLKPHFWYIHTGNEIARLEAPAWIARDNKLVEQVSAISIDQSAKGRGYPVSLAEAHEQAVVKGPDREFFYHLIQKIGIENQKRFFMSQKSIKKRGIGV